MMLESFLHLSGEADCFCCKYFSYFLAVFTNAFWINLMHDILCLMTTLCALQNQWSEMFPCMIGRTSIIDVIFSGMDASRNCALQLVSSSFETLFDSLFFLLHRKSCKTFVFLRRCMQSSRLFHL